MPGNILKLNILCLLVEIRDLPVAFAFGDHLVLRKGRLLQAALCKGIHGCSISQYAGQEGQSSFPQNLRLGLLNS